MHSRPLAIYISPLPWRPSSRGLLQRMCWLGELIRGAGLSSPRAPRARHAVCGSVGQASPNPLARTQHASSLLDLSLVIRHNTKPRTLAPFPTIPRSLCPSRIRPPRRRKMQTAALWEIARPAGKEGKTTGPASWAAAAAAAGLQELTEVVHTKEAATAQGDSMPSSMCYYLLKLLTAAGLKRMLRANEDCEFAFICRAKCISLLLMTYMRRRWQRGNNI